MRVSSSDAAEFLRFLWSGQDGLFELARSSGVELERHLYTKDEALSCLAGQDRFGPLARRGGGEVAETGNVLWVDLDERDQVPDRFAEASCPPSVVVDSGNQGFWAFWKLARPLSSDKIQSWNRGLADRFNGDRGACGKALLARLPGSYRPETGRVAEIAEFSAAVYEPELLASLRRDRSWRSRLRSRGVRRGR